MIKKPVSLWYTAVYCGILINLASVSADLGDIFATDSGQGILPSIYYGTLNFFSNSLFPIIILVFAIFIVLIIIALFSIITKLMRKI